MIDTIDLFEPLDGLLLDLLRSLSRDDWSQPTVAGTWTVRDVVAHLLDTPLRRLSFVRDGCMPDSAEASSDLIAFVNALNADGVRTYGRLSPAVLIDLMTLATAQLREHLASIDPQAPAAFPVSWAGESSSAHWFDVAREYTERWHHQAQIRLAVDLLASADGVAPACARAWPRSCAQCLTRCDWSTPTKGRACRWSWRAKGEGSGW